MNNTMWLWRKRRPIKKGADKQTECRCLKKLNMDITIKTCHSDCLQGQAGLRSETEQERKDTKITGEKLKCFTKNL